MDGRAGKWGSLGRTIENYAYEHSREIGLFRKVQIICELRSIRVIGPQVLLSVGHRSDVYKERSVQGMKDSGGGQIGCGEEGSRDKETTSELYWREVEL